MIDDNLLFLVYDLAGSSRHIWTTPRNIYAVMQINYPEITLSMVENACKSLCDRRLLEKMITSTGIFYRSTRIWYALDLPMRDRYGNIGEEDCED